MGDGSQALAYLISVGYWWENSAQLSERLDFSARGEGEPAPRSTLCKRCFLRHMPLERQSEGGAGRSEAGLAAQKPI